ncbi:TPA: fimbrial-like protein [Providencia stuartii]|nr:fimbrial-like protein [Providencia stuartii]
MQHMKKITSMLLLTSVLGISLTGYPAIAAQTTTTTITASIVGGACDISVPPSVPFGEVQAVDIINENGISEMFDIKLDACNGYGLTPSIKVTGDIDSSSGEDLFITPTSTSQGYGVLLSTAGNTYFAQNDNLAKNDTISAKGNDWNTKFASVLDGTIPMKATLSCGECVDTKLKGGALNASITFSFLYQ